MDIKVGSTKDQMGQQAAEHAATLIREAIEQRGEAYIIVATGASQFETLSHLIKQEGIAWNKVTAFHLDEYVGMEITHPASFRKYLWERFVSQLPLPLAAFHYLNGEGDAQAEADRVGEILGDRRIDVALVGVGENGHLAFNDPPADFDAKSPYLVVDLDADCRKQQLGEGWFGSLEEVPKQAISMSIPRIMSCKALICTAPDDRKAKAVHASITGPVTPDVPASIMQQHDDCTYYLDTHSASLLDDTVTG